MDLDIVHDGVTKVYKNNQTTIPSKVRNELKLNAGSTITWKLNANGTVTLIFETKEVSIEDLSGLGKSKEVTNAVELKRELYK